MPTFRSVLVSLLPPGRFWEFSRRSAFSNLLTGLSKSLDAFSQRLDGLQKNRPDPFLGGCLSKAFIQQRLVDLGFENLARIEDPSEEPGNIDGIGEKQNLGKVYFFQKCGLESIIHPPFRAGAPIREWRNGNFEQAVRQIIPAEVCPVFVYQEGLDVNTR